MFRRSLAMDALLLCPLRTAPLLIGGGCTAPPPVPGKRVVVVGGRLPDGPSAGDVEGGPEALRERMTTASLIASLTTRDRVLGGIALDAASEGEVGLCLEALEQIASLTDRDQHAVEASSIVHRLGSLSGGRQIAETIASITLRDEALSAIAAGQPR